jgi:hypothetical protein
MTDTFSEARYRAERGSLIESLTDTVEQLKTLSDSRRRTLKAAEPPIASAQQPKPVAPPRVVAAPATYMPPQPATSGYAWTPAGGWTRSGPDVQALRRAAALSTLQRMMPTPAPDGARVDSVALSERALALMKKRQQSVDQNNESYRTNYIAALTEVSK